MIESRLHAGTWRWDFGAGNLFWSKGLYQLLGLDPAAVLPSTSIWQELLHPEDRVDISDPASLLRDAAIRDRVVRVLRPDGSMRHIRSISEVFFDRSGVANAVAGVSFDVTNEALLSAEVSRLKSAMSLVEAELGVFTWHLAAASEKSDGITWPPGFEWADEEDRSRIVAAIREATVSGEPFRVAHRARDGRGVLVTIGQPQFDMRGKLARWVGIVCNGDGVPAVDVAVPSWAIRAARAALGWSAEELAARSKLSLSTVRRAEAGHSTVRASLVATLRSSLEAGGVVFEFGANSSTIIRMQAGRERREQR